MEFENNCFDGICDVCGAKDKVVVCASSYGAISLAYCKNCFDNQLEPYNIMVAYISCAGKYPNEINPAYVEDIRRILPFLNKTEEEFIRNVNHAINEINKYYV